MTRSPKPPLSPEQFRDALCKGFGRALLQVRHCGSDGLEAELLHACLHHLTREPFFEGTRSIWLFRRIKQTSCFESFQRPILEKLKNACSETVPDWDGCLLMGLACDSPERDYRAGSDRGSARSRMGPAFVAGSGYRAAKTRAGTDGAEPSPAGSSTHCCRVARKRTSGRVAWHGDSLYSDR
jgi:hypothetical protein